MNSDYKVLEPADLSEVTDSRKELALDVLHGLSGSRKELSSKYFYDETGSLLFQKITGLEDYYPTRCEYEILEENKGILSEVMQGKPFHLIELGVGDGHKTKLLIRQFLEDKHDFRYVPIDISETSIQLVSSEMKREFTRLEVSGVVSEYFDGIRWISKYDHRPNLVLFLGSNIGNFHRNEAMTFLRTLWNSLNDGDRVLIGFDLKKNLETLNRAYNDSQGVTRQFNLNLLRRINNELQADFDLDAFEHYSVYDVFTGAVESYLVSLKQQTVFIGAIGQSFRFRPYEPIHTEYSYKYLESDIDELAAETGFSREMNLFDSKSWFVDSLWKVRKRTHQAT
jgi:dimethylhistidine N-methyltransferase